MNTVSIEYSKEKQVFAASFVNPYGNVVTYKEYEVIGHGTEMHNDIYMWCTMNLSPETEMT